jgi:hypothetical protein
MNSSLFGRVGLVTIAALVAVTAGCAGGYHFSEIEGSRYFKTNIDTYAVVINRVDGRSPLVDDPPVRVDPGMHTIEVQGPPTPTNPGEFRPITLDVKPCTRYYLVAVKANRLDNDFTVRVDYEMPVPGCTPPPAK